ncbi:unnamed protein product [Paramecium sonneborni]|uniref:Uncharacterized protein n=1 Tax=Paramecium sonneborni TaxID=65129 RepID=A0A8S1PWE5_9CILI|nr:unnamed protein product [Paramecium sonneborni]
MLNNPSINQQIDIHKPHLNIKKESKIIQKFQKTNLQLNQQSQQKQKQINMNQITKTKQILPKFQNSIVQQRISQNIWHKKSVSLKMKNAIFKNGLKIQCGQLVKYKKGNQIYAFRCIKDNMKQCRLKELKQDHDVDTDDEQIQIVTKQMFISLSKCIRQEMDNMHNNSHQNMLQTQPICQIDQ